jgi:FtsP/CotA-like multicopper oxidase with cupredoxin domain
MAVMREIRMAVTFLKEDSACAPAGAGGHAHPTTCVRFGDLELWRLLNVDTMDHVFHLHTWPFQVWSHNGKPPPFRAWRDTVNLRPGDEMEILVPFTGFAGRSVYHCHIAEHGDQGMMAEVEVQG